MVYLFGKPLVGPVDSITITHINEATLSQLQHADHIVYEVLCGKDAKGEFSLPNILLTIQQVKLKFCGFPL